MFKPLLNARPAALPGEGPAPIAESLPAHYRRNFTAGMIHGVFFQASSAFANIHTVLPSLVALLTPAASAIGLMAALQNVGTVLPQLYTAYLIDGRERKKNWLLVIVAIRFVALGALAWLVFQFGLTRPNIVLIAIIGLFGLFSFIGGMGAILYADIFSRAIPARRRGRFSGAKQFVGFGMAIGAGYVIKWILEDPVRFPFPANYALILLMSAALLAIAFGGFALIKEPPGQSRRVLTSPGELLHTARRLFGSSKNLQILLLNRSLLTLSLALAPFFVVYARNDLAVPAATIGLYLALQMAGAAASNVLWAWLADSYGNRLVIIGVGFTFALAAALAWLTPASQSWLYGGVFLLLGATLSGVQIGYGNFILEMADESIRPICVAIQNTALAPLALAPLLVGVLATWLPYSVLFAAAAVLATGSIAVALVLRDPRTDPSVRCCLC